MTEAASLDSPMARDGKRVRRGDLYWARIARPDVDEAAALLAVAHPYVVLQDDVLNDSRLETVVVCALTSNLKRMNEPGNVLLEAGEANLTRASVVVVSQVSSLAKAELGEYIGVLSAARVAQIFDGMRLQQKSYSR